MKKHNLSSAGLVGFGGEGLQEEKPYAIALYIANRPMFDHYPTLNSLQPLQPGEVAFIVAHTSNHWRKVFNVYAKFMVELKGEKVCGGRWQYYRDNTLLQSHGHELLLFSPPDIATVETNRTVHIIAGKTYAQSLQLPFSLDWQDAYFAINKEHRVIVCPYLDYRQLSNERITRLVSYVRLLTS